MVGALAGCDLFLPEHDERTGSCPTCSDGGSTPTDADPTSVVDTADSLATPEGVYAYDPECIIGGNPIPTVYYVYDYVIEGTDVTGTQQMVWVSHPSSGIPVCSFSWPVTGTSGPCDEDCDLHLLVRTGDPTNDGCAEDRASWGDLFGNSDFEWFLWSGTGEEVRVAFDVRDDGHPGTLVDGALAFQHTQCNGV
jgi:hypothetical protein